MDKETREYYGAYAYKKKWKSPRGARGRAGVVVAIVLSLLATLIIIFMFADYSKVSKTQITTFKSKDYYGVSLFESNSKAEAESAAAAVKNANGGGYISYEGIYRVYAAAYLSENDAIAIANGISGSSFDPKVTTINIAEKNIDLVTTSKSNSEKIVKKAEELLKTADKLYQVSIDLDKGKIDYFEAVEMIKKEITRLKSAYAEFKSLTANETAAQLTSLKAVFFDTDTELNKLKEASSASLSSEIKYSYLKIIFDIKNC